MPKQCLDIVKRHIKIFKLKTSWKSVGVKDVYGVTSFLRDTDIIEETYGVVISNRSSTVELIEKS